MPMAEEQLNPNQNMAFRVIAFKEETVAEVMTIAPFLLKMEAVEALKDLLARAETFVKPLLDKDASASSARKQLFKLLMLRMRLPEMSDEARRSVCGLLEQMSDGQMQGLLSGLEEAELRALLSADLKYETIERLRTSMSPGVCRSLIDRELACRLVIGLDDDPWFKKLWQLLLQNANHEGSEQQEWTKAAGVVLAACVEKVDTLKDLDSLMLQHACEFLESKEQTINFAKSFFQYDLGIRADQHVWPPTSSASILMELESRATGAEQKLKWLVKAHKISPSDATVRRALLRKLHSKILESDGPSASPGMAFDLEDLFLELILEEQGEIPADVIQKLSLKEVHLQHFKGDLKLLASQLCQANRPADGARAAVMLAQKLAHDGEKESAEDNFLFAFRLDPTNVAAAGGLLDLAKQVIATSQATPAKAPATTAATAAAATTAPQQEIRRPGMLAQQERAGSSARACDPNIPSLPSLQLSHTASERLLLNWDLTGKDFTNCRNEEGESSPKFEISKDVRASITVYPDPAAAKPRCTLNLNRPADVKLRVQVGNTTRTVESVHGLKFKHFDLSSHSDLQGHLTVHALSAC